MFVPAVASPCISPFLGYVCVCVLSMANTTAAAAAAAVAIFLKENQISAQSSC